MAENNFGGFGQYEEEAEKVAPVVEKAAPKKPAEKPPEKRKSPLESFASSLMANHPAPQMHTGGTVPKDGVYELQEGEKVVPKDKKMADKKKHAGHGYKHTHIEHHHDGSHTVHHQHEDGGASDKKYAVQDLDTVHDGLQDHLGQPNPGEAEAEAGPEAEGGAQ